MDSEKQEFSSSQVPNTCQYETTNSHAKNNIPKKRRFCVSFSKTLSRKAAFVLLLTFLAIIAIVIAVTLKLLEKKNEQGSNNIEEENKINLPQVPSNYNQFAKVIHIGQDDNIFKLINVPQNILFYEIEIDTRHQIKNNINNYNDMDNDFIEQSQKYKLSLLCQNVTESKFHMILKFLKYYNGFDVDLNVSQIVLFDLLKNGTIYEMHYSDELDEKLKNMSLHVLNQLFPSISKVQYYSQKDQNSQQKDKNSSQKDDKGQLQTDQQYQESLKIHFANEQSAKYQKDHSSDQSTDEFKKVSDYTSTHHLFNGATVSSFLSSNFLAENLQDSPEISFPTSLNFTSNSRLRFIGQEEIHDIDQWEQYIYVNTSTKFNTYKWINENSANQNEEEKGENNRRLLSDIDFQIQSDQLRFFGLPFLDREISFVSNTQLIAENGTITGESAIYAAIDRKNFEICKIDFDLPKYEEFKNYSNIQKQFSKLMIDNSERLKTTSRSFDQNIGQLKKDLNEFLKVENSSLSKNITSKLFNCSKKRIEAASNLKKQFEKTASFLTNGVYAKFNTYYNELNIIFDETSQNLEKEAQNIITYYNNYFNEFEKGLDCSTLPVGKFCNTGSSNSTQKLYIALNLYTSAFEKFNKGLKEMYEFEIILYNSIMAQKSYIMSAEAEYKQYILNKLKNNKKFLAQYVSKLHSKGIPLRQKIKSKMRDLRLKCYSLEKDVLKSYNEKIKQLLPIIQKIPITCKSGLCDYAQENIKLFIKTATDQNKKNSAVFTELNKKLRDIPVFDMAYVNNQKVYWETKLSPVINDIMEIMLKLFLSRDYYCMPSSFELLNDWQSEFDKKLIKYQPIIQQEFKQLSSELNNTIDSALNFFQNPSSQPIDNKLEAFGKSFDTFNSTTNLTLDESIRKMQDNLLDISQLTTVIDNFCNKNNELFLEAIDEKLGIERTVEPNDSEAYTMLSDLFKQEIKPYAESQTRYYNDLFIVHCKQKREKFKDIQQTIDHKSKKIKGMSQVSQKYFNLTQYMLQKLEFKPNKSVTCGTVFSYQTRYGIPGALGTYLDILLSFNFTANFKSFWNFSNTTLTFSSTPYLDAILNGQTILNSYFFNTGINCLGTVFKGNADTNLSFNFMEQKYRMKLLTSNQESNYLLNIWYLLANETENNANDLYRMQYMLQQERTNYQIYDDILEIGY